nr:hypothetical protein [Allomuricauda sp.]
MKTIKTIIILTILILFQNGMEAQNLRPKIVKSISQIEETHTAIPANRKALLDQLASKIHKDNKKNQNLNVVFIDKNNQTKSQLAAIWLKTGLMYYGVSNYNVLSAGTEIVKKPFTALNSLEPYGFRISSTGRNETYSYIVKSGDEKWKVAYKTYEALDLNNTPAVDIYVESGITPENGSKQIEVLLSSPESIASEMLYIAWRVKYLTEQIQ